MESGAGRARDVGALGERFDRHVPLLETRVRRIVPASLRRRVSVADVVQEARIVALTRGADLDLGTEGSLRAWLLAVVERKALEAVRRHAGTQKRAAGREVSRGSRGPSRDPAESGCSPSHHAMADEARRVVERALRGLPDDYREVLRLSRIRGLTLGEIADRMGRSREAVKKVYGRAVQRFTEALRREKGAGDV